MPRVTNSQPLAGGTEGGWARHHRFPLSHSSCRLLKPQNEPETHHPKEIPMFQRAMLKDGDVEPIAGALYQVLEGIGVYCQNREILEALDKAGAKVDFGLETATFPREMTRELVELVRGEPPVVSDEPPRFGRPGLPTIGTQIAQFTYDYKNKERRSSNVADLIEFVKLGDALAPGGAVGHALSLTDVPALVEPMEAAMILAEYAHRPAPAFAWNVRQVDYLIEMGEIYGLEDWFTWGAICFAHPLRFDRDVADKFVRRVKSGAATGLTAMPVAGMSTPVSTAGFIAVAGAEIVATWLAARAVNPDVPLSGSIWGGSLDMRSGQVSYCSFDAMRYSFALAEFLRRWCGKELTVGGGEYCDAKAPGYYAAMEKAYKAMMIAAFTGRTAAIGQGMLDEGKTLCAVQLLLERELTNGLHLLGDEIEVNPDTLALDTIFEIGHGLKESYMNRGHTVANYREFLWCPILADRSGYNGPE